VLPVVDLVDRPATPAMLLDTVNEADCLPVNFTGKVSDDGFITVIVPPPASKVRLAPLYVRVRSDDTAQNIIPTIISTAMTALTLVFICN
jgi:hypothetical protein